METTGGIRPGEPRVGALSDKARSDRQIGHLLWVVSKPKKEEGMISMSKGRSVQGGKRSRHRDPFMRRMNCQSLDLDNHFLTWTPFRHMMDFPELRNDDSRKHFIIRQYCEYSTILCDPVDQESWKHGYSSPRSLVVETRHLVSLQLRAYASPNGVPYHAVKTQY